VTLTDRLLLIADELAHAEALIEDLAAENARLRRRLGADAPPAAAPLDDDSAAPAPASGERGR